jgi:hypothetical protein
MGNFLNINGWRVPVTRCELQPFEIGSRERAPDGSFNIQRRGVKRRWRVETPLLSFVDANALWNLVQGRGHQWLLEGSSSPQDTSGITDLASRGGLIPTNSPGYTLESTTAADGSPVKWAYSAAASLAPSRLGSYGLMCAPATTNLLSSSIATCSSTSDWSTAGSAVALNTTHKWQSTNCIKVDFSAGVIGAGTRYAQLSSIATLTDGQTYVLSGYVKTTAGGNIGVTVHNTTLATHGELLDQTVPANTWVRFFVKFTASTSPSGSYSIRFFSNDAGASTWYVDGLQLEALSFVNTYFATAWVDGSRSVGDGPRYSGTAITNIQSCTMSAWVRGSPFGASTVSYLTQLYASDDGNTFVTMYIDTDGVPKMQLTSSGIGGVCVASGAAAIAPTSSFYHVCGVLDAVNTTIYVYVNGTLGGSASFSGNFNFTTPVNLAIGSAGNTTTGQSISMIDDVMILPYAAPSGLVSAIASSTTYWQALPRLKISGDAVDGTCIVVGNVSNGSYSRVVRSGSYQKNNIALSFELEEV